MDKETKYKIISGGQTGADQGGLEAAFDLGIPTGGWAPKGYKTENGPNFDLRDKYKLIEIHSDSYRPRTIKNVAKSDITLLFGNQNSPGSKLTQHSAKEYGKPCFNIFPNGLLQEPVDHIIKFILENHGRTINVAGNRESKNPGIELRVYTTMFKVLNVLTQFE